MPTFGFTAGDWIRSSAARFPDRVCMWDVGIGRRLTFAEVERRVVRCANALADLGLGRGDRVAILASDSHRYVETLYACMRIGAVFVPLNTRLTVPEVENFLTTASAPALFVSDRQAELARMVARTVPGLRHLVCFDGTREELAAYEGLLASAGTDDPRVPIADTDVLGLAFTSGTTGSPKGVLQSQRMVKEIVAGCVLNWELGRDEQYYSGAPLFNIAGMAMVFMGAMMGYTNIIAPAFDPKRTLELMAADELTAAFLVPSMISSLLQLPGVEKHDYRRLHSMHYGAAPMPPALLRRAMRTFGCDFATSFGAGTEAGWHTALTPLDHKRAAAGAEHLLASVGRAAPGVELRICDDDWNDVPGGEIGEVVVRSDMIMNGYFDQPEQTAQALHPEGWFRAGDMGYLDAERYLHLSGRKKDVIIRGGENIYPIEIEQVIHEFPGVLECAVVGMPDEHWGELPRAHIVLASGATIPDSDQLRAFCRGRLASYKVPVAWVFESELPRNASGKILKRSLLDTASERR
ncbi:MAG: hypothetical protein QOE61_4400 [Micromonosporaceae bacterium]|nr:hypothetical protein [Micromonosporaceae bacterium]